MPLHTRHEPDALVVQFDRDGEAPECQLVTIGGGRRALIVAVTMLLHREALLVGDRLTVRKAIEGVEIPR
jgi:hypothetical protein